jgi:predicted Zn-dependent protease
MKKKILLILLLSWVPAFPAAAIPFLPRADDVVLERLPERTDPSLKRLRTARAALAADPRNLALATALARNAIEASRENGDPRYLGLAQAALAPWWNDVAPPAAARVLRATIRQSQHDFDGALADLDALLRERPGDGQALLTRSTVLSVRGRYAEALRDCAMLAGRTSPLVVAACRAAPASLGGDADVAYRALAASLARPGDDAGVRSWALTLAAEVAARRGDDPAAERHFRAALALDSRDAYLKAAYADWLLDAGRPADALALVGEDTRNDALLLRIALAEQRLPAKAADFAAHRDELAARFEAARRRGDSLHRREEARFRLTLAGDAAGALALARANWDVQREPADRRILVEAGKAAGDPSIPAAMTAWERSVRVVDAVASTTAPASRP